MALTVSQMNRTHVGRTITIIDPIEGEVRGELRQVFHRTNETILLLNRPFSQVPEGTYWELTLTADRSGIGEPIGLVDHTPAIDSEVVLVEDDSKDSAAANWPGEHDNADRSALNDTVIEVGHDGNESWFNNA